MLLDELSLQIATTRTLDVPKQLGEFRINSANRPGAWASCTKRSRNRWIAAWHSKSWPRSRRADAVYLDRFRSEARTAARLHHTNIVAIHGAGQADGVHSWSWNSSTA